MVIAPTGEQIEIAAGDQQAVVVEVGGGLRSYSAGGRELVDGYGADQMSSSGRGQALIPWPNRLQDSLLHVCHFKSHDAERELGMCGEGDRALLSELAMRGIFYRRKIRCEAVEMANLAETVCRPRSKCSV